MQSDPIGLAGGNMTTYGYGNEEPLSRFDANGLASAQDILGTPATPSSKPASGCDTPDCKAVKDKCIAQCSRSSLPSGNNGFRFWNCVNRCMTRAGCNPGGPAAAPAPAAATGAPGSNDYPEPPTIVIVAPILVGAGVVAGAVAPEVVVPVAGGLAASH